MGPSRRAPASAEAEGEVMGGAMRDSTPLLADLVAELRRKASLMETAPHGLMAIADDIVERERHVYPVYELAGEVIALAKPVEVRVHAERTTP